MCPPSLRHNSPDPLRAPATTPVRPQEARSVFLPPELSDSSCPWLRLVRMPQPSPLPRSPIEMHSLQRLQQSLYLSAYQRRQEPRQYQRRMNALWSSEARTVTASVAGSGTAPRIFKRSITAAMLVRKTTGSPTGSFVHCGASRLSGYPSYVPSTTRRAGSSACGPVVRWRMNESGSANMLSGSSSGACPGPTRHWVQVRRFKRSSSDSAKQSATRPITRCKAQGASEEECGAED